jgi:hypothetical protein
MLHFGPRKYIEKVTEQYEWMFGYKPKEYTSPLEKGDHPEIETSDKASPRQYQGLPINDCFTTVVYLPGMI